MIEPRLALTALLLSGCGAATSPCSDLFPPESVELRRVVDGVEHVLAGGAVYQVKGGQCSFVTQYYDPTFFDANYLVEGGVVYRVDRKTGLRIKLTRELSEDFEHAGHLRDLILTDADIAAMLATGKTTIAIEDVTKRWRDIHVTSHLVPVEDHAKQLEVRDAVLAGTGDFLENRVEPSPLHAHSGTRALRSYAAPPGAGEVTTKASLLSHFIHYVKGDELWYSGWYYVEAGMPATLVDVESTWLPSVAGIRVFVTTAGEPYFELKGLDKPQWRQNQGTKRLLPRNQWFELKIHLTLDAENGLMEMWLDGEKILVATGTTLPIPSAVYNQLEVGVSANHAGLHTTVFTDDVRLSNLPL
jgi:hypothetical protein